jgi:hypothetical protein
MKTAVSLHVAWRPAALPLLLSQIQKFIVDQKAWGISKRPLTAVKRFHAIQQSMLIDAHRFAMEQFVLKPAVLTGTTLAVPRVAKVGMDRTQSK